MAMTRPESALILGGGIIGVTTAYALARRGIAVTLVDRHDGPAMGASHANGAQLSYLYTDALASPNLLPQLPGLALGRDDAFRMYLGRDPGLIGWALSFLRNCTQDRFAANTRAGLELGLESRKAMADLLERHPIDFGHTIAGKIHLYRDAISLERARKVMRIKRNGSGLQSLLTAEEAVAIEPALAHAKPGVTGALYSPQEAVGDALRFAQGLLKVLQSDYGVETRFGFAAVTAEEAQGRARLTSAQGEMLSADVLVDCSGVEGGKLLRHQGVSAPIQAMKGYSFTAPPGTHAPRVSITDSAYRTVYTNLDGVIRVAGMADLGARNDAIDPDRFETFFALAQQAMPQAADYAASYNHWAGLRPMTYDSRPRIGRVSQAIAYNLGHGMLGWTMAMGSAERLAALLEG